MSDVLHVSLLEELKKFQNEDGLVEIVVRNKNKSYKLFQKISLDALQQSEAKEKIEQAIALINKNNHIAENTLKIVNNIEKLNKFSLILNGLNLCATCVGFAIMYAKLDKISSKINEIVELQKSTEGVHVNYEFNKILSEHSNMLDCRKKHSYYSEDQMRLLVSKEYEGLELLTDVFMSDISNNQETLIFSILSLASMLAVSLKYFDETYYFNNKEAIENGDVWHLDHNKWVSIFDKMSHPEFVKKIQDCGFFDMKLNTIENDYFYISFFDQIKSLKQEIVDNQKLIISVNDQETLKYINEQTAKEVRDEIENAFVEAGADMKLCEEALRVVTA